MRSSDSSGDNENDKEEVATAQHGGGMLLLTIVLAVDMFGLMADQSINRVYIDKVDCILGVVVADFLCMVQYWLAEEKEVMLKVEMLGHGNK